MNSQQIIITIISVTLLLLMLVAFSLYIFFAFRKKKFLLEEEKKDQQIQFERQLFESGVEIQEQTLTQISQELHDNIGQAITFARMNLGAVKLQQEDPNKEKLDNANEILQNALTDLRSLSKSMLGEKIAEVGIEQSIRNQAKYITDSSIYLTEITSEGEQYLLGKKREIIAFRIIQEALNNIVKHSGAKKAFVHFHYAADQLIVTIADNGRGAPQLLTTDSGTGLLNMQNRTKLLGGSLEFLQTPGGGLTIKLWVPKKES